MSIKRHGMLTKVHRMSLKLQAKSVVDVDVDSERLQNIDMSKRSRSYFKALQMTLIGIKTRK